MNPHKPTVKIRASKIMNPRTIKGLLRHKTRCTNFFLPVHTSRGNGFQSTKFQADLIFWLSPCLSAPGKVPVVSPLATTTPDRQLNFTAVKKNTKGQILRLSLL